jgi:ribonucleoside-diphosphate reductase alpha chain
MSHPHESIIDAGLASNGAVVETRKPTRPKPSSAAERYGYIPREKFASLNTGKGLTIERRFTRAGVDPFDAIEWERRTAIITDERGRVVFEQHDVEVPAFWSQLATNVVVSKYFRGQLGTPERETSVRQVIGRVVDTLTEWGTQMRYFATQADADAFRDELKHLLLHQYGAFNSPVWFNLGIEPRAQASACFIVSVDDTMESILELAKTEGMIFKFGSGSGSNLSRLRSSQEYLSGGGRASGPVSFMRGFDAFAGVIKSGGKTRRAAKMVVLNIDHPDIVEFIECKAKEEQKAWALIEAGYDPGFNVPGGAYDSVFFQNANHSVRVTDEFMRAVEADGEWHTIARTTGEVLGTYRARELFRKIAEAAWVCGDPGVQFHDTTNRWHTVKNSGAIEASNPCIEFVFLNDTSCNLASLNLIKFRLPDGRFDSDAFRAAVRIFITAQEIIVDNAAYPTEKIADNSHLFRPLGLGYANLGALLMSLGLPYDSDAGRAYAALITALMHGEAYRQSAIIARECGNPFPAFELNRAPMLEVMRMHADALNQIPADLVPADLLQEARDLYAEMLELGERHGYRNAQVTVLAPTGTISFLMDCDTTGIEPDIALVKYKTLVGGGVLKIVNTTVPLALQQLGYTSEEIEAILRYIDEHDTIEGAPYLKAEHLPVFDCAFRPAKGVRSLAPMAHVKMMAAVQPFLSGAISKTVNMPHDATPEDIEQIYLQAWKLGLKAIAIYRDGSKRTQPLSTKKPDAQAEPWGSHPPTPARRTPKHHPQVQRRGTRGLHHRRHVRRRHAWRDFPDDGEGRLGHIGADGRLRDRHLARAAVRRAAGETGGEVLLHTLPAQRLHEQPADSDRDFDCGLHLPLAGRQVPARVAAACRAAGGRHALAEASPIEAGVQGGVDATISPHGQGAVTTDWSKLIRLQQDAPPCPTCGMMMTRAGACYQCLHCGASFGCG